MTQVLTFTIPGPPVPLERARVVRTKTGKRRAFTPPRSAAYKQTVAWSARAAIAKLGATWPRDRAYAMTLRVYWSDARRRDVDNVVKQVGDSLQGIAFDNDHQIVEIHASSTIDRTRPRVEVEIAIREVETEPQRESGKRRRGRAA